MSTNRPHLPMGSGAEFDAIRRLLAAWGSAAEGIGDDAAVLDVPAGERLVLSVDASVEDVHFKRGWLLAEEIGARATAAALSDLAAMAATPRGLLLALALPPQWSDELDAFARGVGAVAAAACCPILGGNISASSVLSLTMTVIGSAASPLRRSGAVPGDELFVTGTLGGAGAALRALLRGESPSAAHRARFASPTPRIAEALWLAAHGAHAAIDISDGLFADAAHLALASGVTLELDASAIPCVADVSTAQAVASGEEYELLVALPPGFSVHAAEFASRFDITLTRIGAVVPAGQSAVMISGSGVSASFGFDHLS